jgi:hypothetical protein
MAFIVSVRPKGARVVKREILTGAGLVLMGGADQARRDQAMSNTVSALGPKDPALIREANRIGGKRARGESVNAWMTGTLDRASIKAEASAIRTD